MCVWYLELVEGGELVLVPRVEGLAAELVHALLHEEPRLGVVQHGPHGPAALEVGRRILDNGRDDKHTKKHQAQVDLWTVVCLLSKRYVELAKFLDGGRTAHWPDSSYCSVARHVALGVRETV